MSDLSNIAAFIRLVKKNYNDLLGDWVKAPLTLCRKSDFIYLIIVTAVIVCLFVFSTNRMLVSLPPPVFSVAEPLVQQQIHLVISM